MQEQRGQPAHSNVFRAYYTIYIFLRFKIVFLLAGFKIIFNFK